MPLSTSVRANVSLFSTYASRIWSRSIARARRRGTADAATTRRTAPRGIRCAMPPTTPERYAVVSCHVERPLDDAVWSAFGALQLRRPGGLAIAALMRPPDAAAGETDEERWLERAREAAARGPLGHHTHFTSPTHARPTDGDTGPRVLREGAWLRERGLAPSVFCGGGWYTDRSVALACAELGYADCTPRRVATVLPRGRRGLGRARRRPRASRSAIGRSPPCRRRMAPATSRALWRGRASRRECTPTSTTPTSSTRDGDGSSSPR